MQKLILGSSSPWRARVLERAGIPIHRQLSPDIDEKAIRFDDPDTLTIAIAMAKAEALMDLLEDGEYLITSDQVVVYDGEIREKPESPDQAAAWLRDYRLSSVETVTAVVVRRKGSDAILVGTDRARVYFGDLPDEAIDTAIRDGNVLKSCGALVHDDPAIQPWIAHIDGTQDSVDGLPLDLTLQFLGTFGFRRPS